MMTRFYPLGFILLAFALQTHQLEAQSLWYDEGVSWMLSQMSSPLTLIQWTAADIQPPFYYLLIWGSSRLFGDSEYALRFLSVGCMTLTVPLMTVLAKHLLKSELMQTAFVETDTVYKPETHSGQLSIYLAPLITAIAPVAVYYSQEARMYTLLMLQATLASYLLLKIIDGSHLTPYYVLVATTALYTHYFAAFLWLTHALYAAIIWWRRGFPQTLFYQLVPMFGWVSLLFAPWLPTLLARLGDDPSYWTGTLKLNEAVRKIVIIFTVGETVFERTGIWLAAGHGVILIGLTIYISYFATRHRSLPFQLQDLRRLSLSKSVSTSSTDDSLKFCVSPKLFNPQQLFLLLWLVIPISLILVLSYQSPKFNPRYTLAAWPAYVLILTRCFAQALWLTQLYGSKLPLPSRFNSAKRYALPILLGLCLAYILLTSTFSLYNWFHGRDFAKDDFRALAQFVKERQTTDETVLLSSGHLFPVWAYYYGWEGWTPLPDLATLDLNQRTQLDIATTMRPALQDKGGVWLVSWQDEVIDPNGVVPFWLDWIGERPHDGGDFWGIRLEHWRIQQPERLAQSPIQSPTSINFNNQLILHGLTQLNDHEIILFWQALHPLPDNLILTLNLTDDAGHVWHHHPLVTPLGSPFYSASSWIVGETVITRHRLPWQAGTPPGQYIATLEVGHTVADTYQGWDSLDEQSRPQRRTVLLDNINLNELIGLDNQTVPHAQNPVMDRFPLIALHQVILPETLVEPGDRIPLALLWQTGEHNRDDISLQFELVDSAQQAHNVGFSATPSRQFKLSQWQPKDVVLGQYWLNIPPDIATGTATLKIHITNGNGSVHEQGFPVGTIEILPTERNFSPPKSFDLPLMANFSDQVTLLGLHCKPTCHGSAGDRLTLTFYWQAKTRLLTDYTIFAHLLDAEETVVLNLDHAPTKSTLAWVANEVITDEIILETPTDLSAAGYTVEVGLYDSHSPAFTRLPLTNGETRVLLGSILVTGD